MTIERKRAGRHSYEISKEAADILDRMKKALGMNKDKLISFSVEYCGKNAESFTDFIKEKALEIIEEK